MKDEMIKMWMPLTKSVDGGFVGILSDTSIDRDDEFMSKELLQDWALKGSLPMLANHENKMEKFVGGWKNLKTKTVKGHTALVAEPFFFSKEASPLAAQMKKLIEEAIANGLNPGISIGAIPKEVVEKEFDDGTKRRGYTKAELVEATIVPVQSNRNASFAAVAKNFDLGLDNKSINLENSKMTNEIKKEEKIEAVEAVEVKAEPVEEVVEAVEEKKEEPVEEKKEEAEVVEEAKEESFDAQKVVEENKSLNDEVTVLKSQIEGLEKKNKEAVLKASVEEPVTKGVDTEPLTIEKMLKLRYGN